MRMLPPNFQKPLKRGQLGHREIWWKRLAIGLGVFWRNSVPIRQKYMIPKGLCMDGKSFGLICSKRRAPDIATELEAPLQEGQPHKRTHSESSAGDHGPSSIRQETTSKVVCPIFVGNTCRAGASP